MIQALKEQYESELEITGKNHFRMKTKFEET